jgi:hypothetical protein
MSGLSIVGSSRSNGEREINDFYPTPLFAVEKLLQKEIFTGSIYEPACGDGAISKVFINKGFEVYSTDLIDRGFGIGGIDFLKYDGKSFDNIITNPPFKYGLEFVEKSKKFANKKVAMFLKTVFLESSSRYEMFQDKNFPLKTMHQFCKRVPIYKNGEIMKNSGLVAYSWFVWDKEYDGKPNIEWII